MSGYGFMSLFRASVVQLFGSRPGFRSFVFLGVCILTVLLIGYSLILAVSSLPQVPLRRHIQNAGAEEYFANNYPRPPYLNMLNKRLDMYTECVGLGVAVNMSPEVKTLLSMSTFGECSGLAQAAAGDFAAPSHPYMRYTHGYQIVLKPLYTIFAVDSVRLTACGITSSLLLLLFVTLRNNLNTAHAMVVVLSFFVTKSSSVFFLVTHAAQFWLVLGGAILSVRLRSRASPLVMFGVFGACDAFLSFLNMGSLSLGLPLLCYTLALWKDNRMPDEIIATLFWGCVGWSIGFVLPWLIKWILLELVLQPTKEQLFGRTLDLYPTRNVQMIFEALHKNFLGLHWRLGLILCALLIAGKLWRRPTFPSGLWTVMFPALIPIIWVCILPGQSGIVHAFFINVILWPCVAAIFLMLLAMPKPQQR